ncbi:MAG TPA: hypothetical protein VFZ71_04640, partial [Pyrinomonadaceae bacterium]
GESDFRLTTAPGTATFAFPVIGLSGTHAFFWSEGAGMKDLGHLGGNYSIAHAVNNNAEVVGYSTLPGGARRAFRWTTDGGMKDLNTLLPANSGWVLTEAWDINDRGQIAGNGLHNGLNRAFRLNLPATTLFKANFDADSFNSPRAIVGELRVEPANGTVNVIQTPLPDVTSPTKWVRVGFPATGNRSSVRGILSRVDGPGIYTITATMFIRDRASLVTLQLEPDLPPQEYLHFMHLDFMPEGDVRIDDGPRFGSYSDDKVFNIRIDLTVNNSSARAHVTLSGPGASGSIDYNLPSLMMSLARRFHAIRFWLNFGAEGGQFFVDNIQVTRRDL